MLRLKMVTLLRIRKIPTNLPVNWIIDMFEVILQFIANIKIVNNLVLFPIFRESGVNISS